MEVHFTSLHQKTNEQLPETSPTDDKDSDKDGIDFSGNIVLIQMPPITIPQLLLLKVLFCESGIQAI